MNDNEFFKNGRGVAFYSGEGKKFLANQVKISLSFFKCRTNCTALCMLSSLAFICPSDREVSEDFESCGQAVAVPSGPHCCQPPGRAGRLAEQRAPPHNPCEGWGWRLSLQPSPSAPGTCSHPLFKVAMREAKVM